MVQYVFKDAPATPAKILSAANGGSGITDSVTTIVLDPGDGSKLPTPGTNQISVCRLGAELLSYTSNVSDTLTGVVRGIETAYGASAASSHTEGTEIRNILSVGAVVNLAQKSGPIAAAAKVTANRLFF